MCCAESHIIAISSVSYEELTTTCVLLRVRCQLLLLFTLQSASWAVQSLCQRRTIYEQLAQVDCKHLLDQRSHSYVIKNGQASQICAILWGCQTQYALSLNSK